MEMDEYECECVSNLVLVCCLQTGDPIYVLLCCWLAAVGAGLLKTEEILEGVARLRISDDVEFEEQTFIAMMEEAREVGFSISEKLYQ